jgi:iron(III) transport system ATP-binding protein
LAFGTRHFLSEVSVSAVGIRVEHVSKQFSHRVKGLVYAVKDVSLTVQPGELLTLLGPSGCGKTTTLRMIAGFERPDAGRVFIGEQDVTDLMANQRNIGFVFQNYALFPHLTVFENVAYGLRVKHMAVSEIGTAVHGVLQMVGLGGYDRQFPNQLSGGEQQRVALARATVIRPRVLLFDEPLSNLDAKLRVHMRGELQQLQKQLSITAVYVTHDQEEAMAISDRIVVMSQGAIAQEGTAESLYRQPASEFVAQFIGRTNLLTARVLSVEAGGTMVELHGLRLRLAGRSPHAQPERPVRLVVRPEVISIEGPNRATGLPGTVASRMFLGEKVEYHVRVGEDLVQVTSYNPRNVFAAGDAVTLTLPTDGIPLLPGGTA